MSDSIGVTTKSVIKLLVTWELKRERAPFFGGDHLVFAFRACSLPSSSYVADTKKKPIYNFLKGGEGVGVRNESNMVSADLFELLFCCPFMDSN